MIDMKDVRYMEWRNFPPMKKEDYARMAFDYIEELQEVVSEQKIEIEGLEKSNLDFHIKTDETISRIEGKLNDILDIQNFVRIQSEKRL